MVSVHPISIEETEPHPMAITEIYGTSSQKIQERQHNVLIGLSPRNRFFVEKGRVMDSNFQSYLSFAIAHTRERIGIFVPGFNETANILILDRKSDRKTPFSLYEAEIKARKQEALLIEQLLRFRDDLPQTQAQLVDVFRWRDVIFANPKYVENFRTIETAFRENKEFHKDVIAITRNFIKNNPRHFSQEGIEKLAYYFLREFAVLVGGVEYGSHDYDLLLYPVMTNVQRLIIDVQNGRKYPFLTSKLQMKNRLAALALA